MNKNEATIIKILSELGLSTERELTQEEEKVLQCAIDPELQFLQDVEKLFNKNS